MIHKKKPDAKQSVAMFYFHSPAMNVIWIQFSINWHNLLYIKVYIRKKEQEEKKCGEKMDIVKYFRKDIKMQWENGY